MSSPPRAWLSALGLMAVCLPLTWACFAQVMADQGRALAPPLNWTADRAAEQAGLALSRFDEARTASQYEVADQLARQALAKAPMQNSALLVLALNADREGRREKARALMSVLGRRTFRDTQVQLWLAEQALAERNYATAFMRLNVALRRDPSLSPVLFPVMADTLDDPAATQALTLELAKEPQWRKSFIAAIPGRERGLERAQSLIMALNRTAAPASDAEVGALMPAILSGGDYAGARAMWLRLTPDGPHGQTPPLYDGAFKGLRGAPPFNWRLRQAEGVVSVMELAPDERPALHVQYSVGRRRRFAEQLLALNPGSYRLTGDALVGDDEAPADLVWTLSCVDSPETALGEASIDRQGRGWRPFSAGFEVPSTGCAAQWLRLANRAQASFEVTDAWFSAMKIYRD